MGLFDLLSKPPSKDAFAKMVMDGIRRAGETGAISYDKAGFLLVGPNQKAYLGNLYPEFCSVPRSRRSEIVQKTVRNWFAGMHELPEDFEDVRPDLHVALRDRAYFELVALQVQAEGHEGDVLPHQIIGEHFGASLVYDLPQSMMYVRQDQLDAWGVTLYEALEVVRQNLAQMEHPFMGPKEGTGVFLSAARDGYDASRLLFLDLIRRFPVKGTPVAMVPNRDMLIVAGDEDVDGLRAMLALTKDAMQQPRFMLAIALRLEGDEWEPWMPDQDHPLYAEFTALRVESFGMIYQQQRELLDKFNQRNGEDVYVGEFGSLEETNTKRVLS